MPSPTTRATRAAIHALIVWNCNPLVMTPNAELVWRGLERNDLFTAVQEQFLTDTSRYADLVLLGSSSRSRTCRLPDGVDRFSP